MKKYIILILSILSIWLYVIPACIVYPDLFSSILSPIRELTISKHESEEEIYAVEETNNITTSNKNDLEEPSEEIVNIQEISQEEIKNAETKKLKSLIKITNNSLNDWVEVIKQEYDEEGKIVKEIYQASYGLETNKYFTYDETGKLLYWEKNHNEGTEKCTFQYSADGLLEAYWTNNSIGGDYSEAFTYTNGQLSASRFWAYFYVANREYKDGLLVFEAFSDGDPETYYQEFGEYLDVHYIEYEYDDKGNEIAENYISTQGGYVLPKSSTSYQYNEDDTIKWEYKTSYYDPYYSYEYDYNFPYKVYCIDKIEYIYEYY